MGNSAVLPFLKESSVLVVRDRVSERVRNHAAKEGKSNCFLLFTFPFWVTCKVLALS